MKPREETIPRYAKNVVTPDQFGKLPSIGEQLAKALHKSENQESELFQCPYDYATKCTMKEGFYGCEEWAKKRPEPLRFKMLKHKTLEGMFGVIFTDDITGRAEILRSEKPMLLGIKTNVRDIKTKYFLTNVIGQLDQYDLVEVEVKII